MLDGMSCISSKRYTNKITSNYFYNEKGHKYFLIIVTIILLIFITRDFRKPELKGGCV